MNLIGRVNDFCLVALHFTAVLSVIKLTIAVVHYTVLREKMDPEILVTEEAEGKETRIFAMHLRIQN